MWRKGPFSRVGLLSFTTRTRVSVPCHRSSGESSFHDSTEKVGQPNKCQTAPQCLKITQNVAFEFFEFCHFPPIFVQLKGDNQIKFSMSQISGSGDPRVQISPNFGCRPYGPCQIDCAGQPAAS